MAQTTERRSIFEKLDDKFEILVEKVAEDIVEEGRGFNTFPKTRSQIITDCVGVFIENLTIRECRFYLTYLPKMTEHIDDELSESFSSQITKVDIDFNKASWALHELVDKQVTAHL